MDNFGILDSLNNSVEFINLYSDDNPIITTNDFCYFLFWNNMDYHKPLIAKGIIIEDKFIDGMNKLYSIKLLEILETPKTIKDFVIDKSFFIFPNDEKEGYVSITKRLLYVNEIFDFSKFVFKVPAFFVRITEEKIQELRTEYVAVLKRDIMRQLKEIETNE